MRPVTEDLWEETSTIDIRGVARMAHRMTVVRSADGLSLHSPVMLEPGLAAEIDALGAVRRIIAPSLMHDLFLQPWLERYPGAEFLNVEGFAEAHPELPAGRPMARAPLPTDLSAHPIAGMPKVRECAMLHLPSRTLVVADLIFNLHEAPDLRSRFLLWLNGAWRRTGPSRLLRMLIADRRALRESVDELLSLDFDRIVVGHGDNVEERGKEVLREAWAWLS